MMQSAEILINELQLGDKLAQAVCQNRQGDFALLMAMMSHNVMDNAQFSLPSDSPGAEEVDEQRLRDILGLGPKPSYQPNENSAAQSIMLGIDLHTEGLAEVKLNAYLKPEPLALHDDAKYVDESVVENCEPATRLRLAADTDTIAPKLEANPAGLYEVLEQLHQAA